MLRQEGLITADNARYVLNFDLVSHELMSFLVHSLLRKLIAQKNCLLLAAIEAFEVSCKSSFRRFFVFIVLFLFALGIW